MESIVTIQECFQQKSKEEEEFIERSYSKYKQIVSTLPKGKGWITDEMVQFQGFWFQPWHGLLGAMWMQEHFKARPDDVLLVTTPKSGTTWFKGLIFSIMNRNRYDFSDHPLLTSNPHKYIPFLEIDLFVDTPIGDPEIIPSPRLLATHIPYTLLPESCTSSSCRIVYVCRNPKDVFVSLWHFATKLRQAVLPALSLEDAFDLFSNGVSPCGPFWDHVLEYRKASLERPGEVLFLKYEEMKSDPVTHVKKLAEFLGRAFSKEEEEIGLVQEVIKLCSYENMSSLAVNKTGAHNEMLKYNMYFRQGKVGDWKNHLAAEMIDRLDCITKQKLSGFGLTF